MHKFRGKKIYIIHTAAHGKGKKKKYPKTIHINIMKAAINTGIHKSSKKGFAFQLESFRNLCNRDRREGGVEEKKEAKKYI